MKTYIACLSVLICLCIATTAGANDTVIKRGGLIGKHMEEGSPLVKTYGKPSQLLDSPSSIPARSNVMMWRVGEGVLVIETSFSAGIIDAISYVLTDSKGQTRTTLAVKEFNPATGEMTIIIPNQASEVTPRKLGEPQR
jgi:hypothetical protein